MYEGCHLTPGSSKLEVFGDYWQIFQKLRRNFHSTDFFFFKLLSYLAPKYMVRISSQLEFTQIRVHFQDLCPGSSPP